MRGEIPGWVAIVVILVIVVVAGLLIWRGTGVQKVQETPEQMPGAMMGKYGAPGVITPGGGQQGQPQVPTGPAGPGGQGAAPAPGGQTR
ncbi:MAG: hypothetical protein NZ959_11830 [Armatimonadetes bacterium]|nr:hypothetical protein [Armatimonadota bacterium]MDW8122673.1 hypothetical protein [Armatimonadota bacterium]